MLRQTGRLTASAGDALRPWPLRARRLAVVSLAGLLLVGAGCGSDDQPAGASAPVPTGAGAVTEAGADPETEPTAAADPTPEPAGQLTGAAGSLKDPPLVYRGAGTVYVVVFRTRDKFATTSPSGEADPGTLSLEGAESGRFKGFDGYLGVLSRASRFGVCHLWVVIGNDRLANIRPGNPVDYAFRLPGLREQSGSAVLHGASRDRLIDDLHSIGCRGPVGERARTLDSNLFENTGG